VGTMRYWDGNAWTADSTPAYPGAGGPSTYAPAPGTPTSGNGFSIAAMVLGGIAFLLLPILFGPIAIVLAAVALSKNEPKARTGMTVAVTGTIVGMILGAMVALL
jgi:hypothetical protein